MLILLGPVAWQQRVRAAVEALRAPDLAETSEWVWQRSSGTRPIGNITLLHDLGYLLLQYAASQVVAIFADIHRRKSFAKK